MKTPEEIYREGCKLENHKPTLLQQNLAAWTAREYTNQLRSQSPLSKEKILQLLPTDEQIENICLEGCSEGNHCHDCACGAYWDGQKEMRDKAINVISQLSLPAPSAEDELQRLYGWFFMDNRPPAQTFFTASPLRDVAKEIEFRLSRAAAKVSDEEIIEKAKEYAKENYNINFRPAIEDGWIDCAKWMRDKLSAPTEKESGWISVKDRLPEKEGYYLTISPSLHVSIQYKVLGYQSGYGCFLDSHITHWMPLPEAPTI